MTKPDHASKQNADTLILISITEFGFKKVIPYEFISCEINSVIFI